MNLSNRENVKTYLTKFNDIFTKFNDINQKLFEKYLRLTIQTRCFHFHDLDRWTLIKIIHQNMSFIDFLTMKLFYFEYFFLIFRVFFFYDFIDFFLNSIIYQNTFIVSVTKIRKVNIFKKKFFDLEKCWEWNPTQNKKMKMKRKNKKKEFVVEQYFCI